MVRAPEVQYTVRGVPAEVDHMLRERARATNQSLNQIIVAELIRATIGNERKADFSDVLGKWTPDEGFDATISAQRQIDWEKWK